MILTFDGPIWFWRGPAPWYFVSVPAELGRELKAISAHVTYGWGMIPARVHIGTTSFKTALWPKDGSYIVPLSAAVRRAEQLDEGDTVLLRLEVG